MRTSTGALSPLEVKMLMQIRLQARLDPGQRVSIQRLIHFGLIEETPDGLRLSSAGDSRCRAEARRLGFGDRR